MGRRRKFCGILIASYFSILPTSSTAHQSWLRSAGVDATVVSVRTGHDVNISVGLSQVGDTNYSNDNKSLHKQEIEVITHMIENIIKIEEGFRSKPYLCSEGYVTIGYGSKLHKSKGMDPDEFTLRVSEETAFALLKNEVNLLDLRLTNSHVGETYNSLSRERKAIILSMAYQLGINGVLQFRMMWEAISRSNFVWAANEMMDSKWATQTRGRAVRHSTAMLNNSLDAYKD